MEQNPLVAGLELIKAVRTKSISRKSALSEAKRIHKLRYGKLWKLSGLLSEINNHLPHSKRNRE